MGGCGPSSPLCHSSHEDILRFVWPGSLPVGAPVKAYVRPSYTGDSPRESVSYGLGFHLVMYQYVLILKYVLIFYIFMLLLLV